MKIFFKLILITAVIFSFTGTALSYYNVIPKTNSSGVKNPTPAKTINSRVKSDSKYNTKNAEKNLYIGKPDPYSIEKTNELERDMDKIIRERYNIK